MSKPLTQILQAATSGDHAAAADLLPAVYTELRQLARARMSALPAGQTLQATALVHEAYVRLVDGDDIAFDGRTHFFFAAARAMRDIVVEDWRRKASLKRGGGRRRLEFERLRVAIDAPCDDLLALNEALEDLERVDPNGFKVIMLRFFAGLTEEETATLLGVTARTVRRQWQFLRVALKKRVEGTDREIDRQSEAASRGERTVGDRAVEPSSESGDSPSVPPQVASPIARALEAAVTGGAEAALQLVSLLAAELRRLARAGMPSLAPGRTLRPRALISDAYEQLIGSRDPGSNDRGHFFDAAAQAIREIIVEQARREAALTRGEDREGLDIERPSLPIGAPSPDVLAIDDLLRRLEAQDPQKVKIVNLCYYAGLTAEETAEAIGESATTVRSERRFVRAWLQARLAERADGR